MISAVSDNMCNLLCGEFLLQLKHGTLSRILSAAWFLETMCCIQTHTVFIIVKAVTLKANSGWVVLQLRRVIRASGFWWSTAQYYATVVLRCTTESNTLVSTWRLTKWWKAFYMDGDLQKKTANPHVSVRLLSTSEFYLLVPVQRHY